MCLAAGGNSKYPLFCVEYTPYCSIFAFSPVLQPNTNYCCLLLPLVPPASPVAQEPPRCLPLVTVPSFASTASASPDPVPESPAVLCYFPISYPTPAETPVLCLQSPRRPKPEPTWWNKLETDLGGPSGWCSLGKKGPMSRSIPPCEADQAPMVLLRKKKPNLRRFTVSPESHSPRASGDRSRQKPWWLAKVPIPREADQVVQQEVLMCNTKLKRPNRERRNLVPSSQPMTENPPDRAKKGDPSAPSQSELHPALSQAFQGTNSPQVLSEFSGPPLTPTTVGGPRRASFRFRDEDFYSILSLNSRRESDDTEEQTQLEECLWVVSHFPNQNDNGSRMAASGFTDEKETSKIKADPEKLKKLQESLLEEDSEEEGDLCRICQIAGGSPSNPLLQPCCCVGSLQFVHQECLKTWLKVKITSGADLGAVKTCEMCKQGLLVDLGDFNMIEFYQKHQQSQAQNELMNSGLYLVLLLHLYEQRFAELMRLNHNQVERERIRSWEMEMKAEFLKAGSSSKETNCGARRDLSRQPFFLHPQVPPSLLLITETETKAFTVSIFTLCHSLLGSGLSIYGQPQQPV
ncbi:probable E3 ubiquitin-protein ligase MARCHF10 [Hylobates moloch]|uniref:probable E3 ubiquitin-protein ligase MARCHF10 n=1 Tax=Hylobates moloch TaxID=81572 RepID=UPI00267536E3|nr:probable E3 ubiquitin-protein ligase MARCHF10 [Hylobates moloch]